MDIVTFQRAKETLTYRITQLKSDLGSRLSAMNELKIKI